MEPPFVSSLRTLDPRARRLVAKRASLAAIAAHAFHRFAHHPLCDVYRAEVVSVGRRIRICKGCALAAAGLVAGPAFGAVVPFQAYSWLLIAASLAGALVAGLSTRRTTDAGRSRASKWATRFLPAALGSAAAVHGFKGGWIFAVFVLAAAFAAAAGARWRYARRGPDRSPCSACPQRDAHENMGVVCDGFRPIVARERAFQRWSRRLYS